MLEYGKSVKELLDHHEKQQQKADKLKDPNNGE